MKIIPRSIILTISLVLMAIFLIGCHSDNPTPSSKEEPKALNQASTSLPDYNEYVRLENKLLDPTKQIYDSLIKDTDLWINHKITRDDYNRLCKQNIDKLLKGSL
ncbi:hypothetical protein [Desulfotomaculum nigrificans]|uniref:hypothetical protein n=1 Tax=Desulfotomaculum nigrificans TaxID=1565 RepID=UPI00048855F4|nr:hypothetical protein [Desulfotomaculum nigrificans]